MQLAELTEKLKALPLEGSLAGVLHITNDSLCRCGSKVIINRNFNYGKDWITEKFTGTFILLLHCFIFSDKFKRCRAFISDSKRLYWRNKSESNL